MIYIPFHSHCCIIFLLNLPNISFVFYQVLYNGYFHCAEPILEKFIAALEKERERNEANLENEEEMILEEQAI